MPNNNLKKILISLLIHLGIGIFIFLVVFFSRLGIDHYVADSFSVTGIVLLGYCAIKFVAGEGIFNVLGFWFHKFINMFKRGPKTNLKYYDYVAMKKEEEKPILWPTLLVGGIFFLIGLILSLSIVI